MFPARVFRRATPGSGIAAEAGIVTLRFYAARSMAGSPPVTLLDVETVPQCPHAPQHAETRRGVASIRYRTDLLDLLLIGVKGRPGIASVEKRLLSYDEIDVFFQVGLRAF